MEGQNNARLAQVFCEDLLGDHSKRHTKPETPEVDGNYKITGHRTGNLGKQS